MARLCSLYIHFPSPGNLRLHVVARHAGSQETRSEEISRQFTCKFDSSSVITKDEYLIFTYRKAKHDVTRRNGVVKVELRGSANMGYEISGFGILGS